MIHFITTITGFILICLESSVIQFMGLESISFHFIVAIMIYLAANREFAAGSLILVLLAYVSDITSGGLLGISSMAITMIYLPVRYLNDHFLSNNLFSQAVAAMIASILFDLLVLLFLIVVDQRISLYSLSYSNMLYNALSCSASLIVFYLLFRRFEPSSVRGQNGPL